MEGLLPALLGGLKLSAKLILIIVPLVTLFEVLRYLPVFRRAGSPFCCATRMMIPAP